VLLVSYEPWIRERAGPRALERRSSCGTGDRSWEKPTKIFSQISPKRSPGTTQGPDPL